MFHVRVLLFACCLPCGGCAGVDARPARIGVSIGVSQVFAGAQGTAVSVAVIPQWDLRPQPVAKVADTTPAKQR